MSLPTPGVEPSASPAGAVDTDHEGADHESADRGSADHRRASGRRVAFITGAAHGQGRAVALALARQGYAVVAFDLAASLPYPGYPLGRREDLASLEQEVTALGGHILTQVGDVRVDEEVAAAVDAAVRRFGRIDVLFNNAGVAGYGLAHELTQEIGERSAGNLLPVPWVEVEDVVHMVTYLASDAARYVTGAQFVLDAGLLTR